jgi:hypothetical protein
MALDTPTHGNGSPAIPPATNYIPERMIEELWFLQCRSPPQRAADHEARIECVKAQIERSSRKGGVSSRALA